MVAQAQLFMKLPNILFSHIDGHPNYRAMFTTFMVILIFLYITFMVTLITKSSYINSHWMVTLITAPCTSH